MKFQSILETPQKSTDTIPLIQPKAFTNNVKHHLIHRLKPDGTNIALDNFMKTPVAEEYCLKVKLCACIKNPSILERLDN